MPSSNWLCTSYNGYICALEKCAEINCIFGTMMKGRIVCFLGSGYRNYLVLFLLQ